MTSSGGALYLSGSGSGSYSLIRPVFSVSLSSDDNGSTTGQVTQINPTITAASYYNTGMEVPLQYFYDFTVDGSAVYVPDGSNRLIRKISVMPQETFIVTVSNASGNNRFAIDGVEIPAKTLMRGTTYRFMQSDASNNGQLFYIATSAAGAGAAAYGTGWTYEGTAGDDGTGLFTVPENAPDTLYYQSSAQTGMGAVLTIEDAPSPSVTIAGRLTNSGQVKLPGSTLTLHSGADLTGGDLNLGDGKLVMEGSLTKTGGTVTTASATLKLNDNISITSNDELIFQDLDLDNSTLTLGSATSDLKVSNTVTLDNATEGINAGSAALTLSGGLTLTDGDVEANGGTISLDNTSTIATDGMLDVSNSTLKLNAGLSVAGTLKTDNTTTLTLNSNALDFSGGQAATGGVLEASGTLTLDGMTFDDKTTIKLNADTIFSSNAAFTVKTIEMGTHFLLLGSNTTDLTITDNITINYPGKNGLNSGAADLTLNSPVNVLMGGILSSGGTVTFGTGATGTSFAEENTGMLMVNTNLNLQTDLNISGINLSGTSLLQTNGNKLNIGRAIELAVQNEFDFTDVTTDNETYLELAGDVSITKTGDLVFRALSIKGYKLTLNPNITSLTTNNIWLLNDWDSSDANYMASTGELLAQSVDVTLTKPLWVEKSKFKMDNGTLTLEQGGELGEGGELDLTGSTLELTGPFYNNKGKGTLTTSASTLSLKSNVKFEPGNDVTFNTYEPNGWGMVLHNDMDNGTRTHLTLGTNGVDLILQPNTEALTSGFVNYYSSQNGAVFSTHNHVIGIKSYEVELTINGNLKLKDNATILGYEENISLGNLTLENGNISLYEGTLSLAGGSVGANGLIRAGWQATLNLGGNLAVAGTLYLDYESSLNLAGNTLDLSGGKIEMRGVQQNLDGITTDNATTLKINEWAHAFRTDSGTTTVGNLEMAQVQDPDDNSSNDGSHFDVDNMSLNVAGNIQIELGNINFKNGTLTLQQTVSADNGSIRVMDGELILQDGLSFSNGNLYLDNSVFKPKGSVLLADSWYGLNNSTAELQGDTTLSRNGDVYFNVTDNVTSLDLNGNTLTLNVDNMTIDGALSIGTGEALSSGSSNLYLNDNLTIVNGGALSSDNGSVTISSGLALNNGGTLSSGNGDVEISGAITLDGDLLQGGGILNLIGGGAVGSTGRLDVSDSELKLGSALSFVGTLVVDNGTSWSGLGGTLDLSEGTLESSGGKLSLDQFTTGANTAFKLSGNTEISSSDNMTFGSLDLGGNRLTLGTGSTGLTLPNTLTMDNASSAIETKNENLTLGKALSLTSGSITSTGGTLSFQDNLTLGSSGALDVTGSTLSVSQDLDLGSGTFSSDNSSMLDLQAAIKLTSNNQVLFGDIHFNGNVLTLGSASTHLKVNDNLTLDGIIDSDIICNRQIGCVGTKQKKMCSHLNRFDCESSIAGEYGICIEFNRGFIVKGHTVQSQRPTGFKNTASCCLSS